MLAEASTFVTNPHVTKPTMLSLISGLFAYSLTSTLLVIISLLLAIITWVNSRQTYSSRAQIPPYPVRPHPFFGHLLMCRGDPRKQLLEWREKCGNIYSLKFCMKKVIFIHGYDAIKEVLVKNADVVSGRPKTLLSVLLNEKNKGVINASGPTWKEQRTAALTILRNFGMGKNIVAKKIEEEVGVYIEKLAQLNGSPQDVRVTTGISISNVICSIIIGRKFDHDDPFFRQMIQLISDIMSQLAGTALLNQIPFLRHLPGDMFKAKRLQRSVKDISEGFMAPIIALHQRRFNPEDEPSDFIYAYLKEMKDKEDSGQPTTLNEDNLSAIIKNLFSAGSETTGSTIMWCILYLMHHPLEQENVYQEIISVVGTDRRPNIQDRAKMNYLNAVIMETQRLASIAPFAFQRLVERDFEVQGYTIPAGSVVIPHLDSVLWDKDLWEDPQAFRPSRFLDDKGGLVHPPYFIPFSIGKRVCLGEALAKMELFLFLSAIFQRFRVAPPGSGPLPTMKAKFGMTCTPHDFKIRLIERKNILENGC